jgi:hypothetical protein
MKRALYAFFAQVGGEWRFEGLKEFPIDGDSFDEAAQKFQDKVERDNGHDTARVVHVTYL